MRSLTIGITIGLATEETSLWVNGAKQNIFFLYDLLAGGAAAHNVYIVNVGQGRVAQKLDWDIKKYKLVEYEAVTRELDLCIELGMQLSPERFEELRNNGAKIVSYRVGNEYVIDFDNIFFAKEKSIRPFFPYDEVWTSTHYQEICKHYLSVTHRCPTRIVPLVWEPQFFEQGAKQLGVEPHYVNRGREKNLVVLEPNLNVTKNCLYPMLIAEAAYRAAPELVKGVYVTNTRNLREETAFVFFANNLDIVKDKKAFFEDRFPAPWLFASLTDVVVSLQWENALNYLYFEALYAGYPLVHNSPYLRDCGYYYEGFDVDAARDVLLEALRTHDERLGEYEERARECVRRFSVRNPENVEAYEALVQNLFQ